jgi:hypothetical protein
MGAIACGNNQHVDIGFCAARYDELASDWPPFN